MSTLNRPIGSRCSIALTYPVRSHFQRILTGIDGAKVRMNVAAHQQKKNDENTKTGKRKENRGDRL